MFSGMLLLALTTMFSPPAHAQESAKDLAFAKIKLDRGFDARDVGGLVYGGTSTMTGKLVFLDAAGRDLGNACPVIVRNRSLGATLLVAETHNGEISLSNVGRKTPKQLLGSYLGLQAGAAWFLGGAALAAANSHGVLMADGFDMEGLGINLSIPKVNVIADPTRMNEFKTCNWNLRLNADSNYAGPGSPGTSDASESKTVAGSAQSLPGAGAQPANQAVTIR